MAARVTRHPPPVHNLARSVHALVNHHSSPGLYFKYSKYYMYICVLLKQLSPLEVIQTSVWCSTQYFFLYVFDHNIQTFSFFFPENLSTSERFWVNESKHSKIIWNPIHMTITLMTQNWHIYHLMKYDIIDPMIRTHNDRHRSTADRSRLQTTLAS